MGREGVRRPSEVNFLASESLRRDRQRHWDSWKGGNEEALVLMHSFGISLSTSNVLVPRKGLRPSRCLVCFAK